MRIQFERTGGFAGMRQSATIDTASLSIDQTRALESAIESAHFFDLPAQIAAPAQAADFYHYRVTIEAEAKRHTVDVDEPAASPGLQPLLQQLTQLARTTHRT
jgi:hypothetical protein